MRLRQVLALTLGSLAVVAVAHAQSMQLGSHRYTAQTAAAARVQGHVVAGGITWACQGNVCSTSGPWPRPSPEACRSLADQVGRVTAYGREGAALSASDLATCNAGQTAQALPRVRVPVGPVRRTAITTPEISLVGGAITAAPARQPTITVSTDELHLVGGAVAAPAPAAVHATIVVDTAEISLVGR
jgi:hypothetical protein